VLKQALQVVSTLVVFAKAQGVDRPAPSGSSSRAASHGGNVQVAHRAWITAQSVRHTHGDHGTQYVTTRQFAAALMTERVLPTVRLWTATQHDWNSMRDLGAARTSGEMGCVFPGLSASWATATVTACRGTGDVRGMMASGQIE